SDGDEGNCERREDCADVRAAVKDACRQSALLLREPLRHRLNRCREVASFAKPQSETRRPEAESGARKRVAHRSDCPESDGEREALACPESVHQIAYEQQTEGIGGLERCVDIAVLCFVPADG